MKSGSTFEANGVLQCASAVQAAGAGKHSMEEVASEIVEALRDRFIDTERDAPAIALARFYITRRISELEPELQDFAQAAGTDAYAQHNSVCLTLLATVGDEVSWNDRRASIGHKAIPLPSVEAIHRLPMVARLVDQLGLDPNHLVEPDPALFSDLSTREQSVFFVSEARGSDDVPAQVDFVIPYGIRSVVGFGGILPDGSLYCAVLFSTVSIPASAVDSFVALSLSAKLAVLPFVWGRVFDGEEPSAVGTEVEAGRQRALLEAKAAALDELLERRMRGLEAESSARERLAADNEELRHEVAGLKGALERADLERATMGDGAPWGVIGMDSEGRITSFNRSAEETFGFRSDEVVGQSLGDTLIPSTMRERHRHALARLLDTGETSIVDQRIEVNALHKDAGEFPIELLVRQIAVPLGPEFIGFTRNLTAERQTRADLATGREHLAHIARTLQTSLLPPLLPEISGYEISADFRAMGAGFDVGGDFYDVFELGNGRWAFTLGDVCGKGSEAAAITALARYTLRAAAMRDTDPSVMLSVLNEAVYRHDPNRFCTAVCLVLDSESGRVDLAIGGHPSPLRVSRSGEVVPTGVSSPLIGPSLEWRGVTTSFTLPVGEAIVLYSDGVTDARRGGDFFGEDRLVSNLAANAALPLAGVVAAIDSEIIEFAYGDLGDDVAILALRRQAI
jgi:sigma-B regulation protein RsbU (phosphoserine phosphatase)